MELYSRCIEEINALLPEKHTAMWAYSPERAFPDGDKNAIIFRSDVAFELGGSGLSSVSSVVFENGENINDSIILYGDDLKDIKKDTSFAHFTFVGMKTEKDGEYRYEELKNTEFSVYKIHPDGYNIRISPTESREQVRVGKNAVEKGISFENIGANLIREFKKNPCVESVKTVFVTLDDFDYKAAFVLAKKAAKITSAIDTSLSLGSVDCKSCSMKAICNEVEGLRELHFRKAENKK